MDIARFEALGREAQRNGEPNAPIWNAEVFTAIENLPVGAGAADIMRAFSRGWTTANLEH